MQSLRRGGLPPKAPGMIEECERAYMTIVVARSFILLLLVGCCSSGTFLLPLKKTRRREVIFTCPRVDFDTSTLRLAARAHSSRSDEMMCEDTAVLSFVFFISLSTLLLRCVRAKGACFEWRRWKLKGHILLFFEKAQKTAQNKRIKNLAKRPPLIRSSKSRVQNTHTPTHERVCQRGRHVIQNEYASVLGKNLFPKNMKMETKGHPF